MEDAKLAKWLDTVQTYLDIHGSNGSWFAKSMKQLWKDEMELLSNNKNVRPVTFDLEQSSEEFKYMLSRVVLPRLLERFQYLLENIHNKEFKISSDLNDCSFQSNLNYCFQAGEPDKDIVTLLCALSDFMGRIQHSFSADNKQLTKIQAKETKVFQRISHSQEIRASKLRVLKGVDEDKIIFKACDGLSTDIKNAKNDLLIAMLEEEEAKKAYERAMAKTKSVRDKISQLESVSSTVENQRSLLITVNEKCDNEDAVVKSITENRLSLVTSLQNTFQDLWSHKIKETVYSTTASSFQTLWDQFKASSKLNAFHLRIGREILTLWKKQMTSDNPTSLVLKNCLEELDNDINNTSSSVANNNADKADDEFASSTVVLYNTLDYHETPVDIVESQARTKTAVEIILQQFHRISQHTAIKSYDFESQLQEKQRTLALKECNDVTSVPLYCLPLVHSAQYLHRLYNFSKEANDEDLYVPLEFDTEWETEVEYSDSDSDNSLDMEVIRGRPRTMKLKKLNEESLQSVLQHRFPAEKIHELVKAMNLSRRESRLASKFSLANKVSLAEDNDHSNIHENTTSSTARNHRYSVGQRVRTLYGDGIIIADDRASGNPAIYSVLLLWGAKAYLNKSCFVNQPSEPTVLSPSLEIKRENPRAHRLSIGKSMKPKHLQKSSSSMDKTLPNAIGNRFNVTDFHLHKLVRRILNIVQSNRFLVENIPLRDAFFSLWLHGRTRGPSNQNLETSIRNWLKRYDPEELHKLLCKYESIMATTKSSISVIEDFIADFKKLPVDNRRQTLSIYGNEEDLKKSTAELRQEAWEFSCSKILNRRGSMLKMRRRKSSLDAKQEDNGDDDDDAENSDNDDEIANAKGSEPQKKRRRKMKKGEYGSFRTSVSTDDNISGIRDTPKKRQREKRVVYHNPVLRSDLQPAPNGCYRTEEERVFNEDIRFLCARLCQKLKLSQTDMVTELVTNFDIQVAQGNISSWMRHKMGLTTMYRLSEVIVQWMQYRKEEFLPEDQSLLENVKVRLSSLSAPQGRVNHIARKHKKDNYGNITHLSQTYENRNDNSTIDANMIVHSDDIDKITGKVDEDSENSVNNEIDVDSEDDDDDEGEEEEEDAHDDIDRDSVSAIEPADVGDRRATDISNASSDDDAFSDSLHHTSTHHMDVSPQGKKVQQEKHEHQGDSDSDSDLESETTFYSVRDGTDEHDAVSGLGKKRVIDINNSSTSNNETNDDTAAPGQTKMEVVDDVEVQENNDRTIEMDDITEPTNAKGPSISQYSPGMIRQLLDSFLHEINRRKLTHAYIEGEACRMGISVIVQPTISRFLRTQDAPYLKERRDEFCNGVAKWLDYSKSRPPPYLKDQAGHFTKDLFCSECNIFTSRHCHSIREFHEHLMECGKPANATAATAVTTKRSHVKKEKHIGVTSNEGEQEVVEENDNEDENVQSANGFLYFYELSNDEIQKAEDKLASHQMDIQMYPYPRGMRYPICGQCGVAIGNVNSTTNNSTRNVLGCSTCPVQYHVNCLKDSHAGMKGDSWYCPTCEENGAAETIEIPEDLKRTALTPNMCIYCFFPEYRCWKAGIFVANHSQQAHMGLVRFDHLMSVNADQEEEDPLQWINLDLSIIRIPQERSHRTHLTRKKRKFSSMLTVNERRPRLRSSFQAPGMSSSAKRIGAIARGKHAANSYSSSNRDNSSSNVMHKDDHSTPSKRGRPRSVRSVVESPPNHPSAPSRVKHTVTTVADKTSDGMTDTYISATTMQAALASAGIACKAVDVVMQNVDANAFACIRPPGHHAGRHGCTPGCLSTGFCILNNAALALVYARVTYGLRKIAVVDFDVHFGNGTADILRGDPNAFFASVHMVYGAKNDGHFDQTSEKVGGFYPAQLGCTDIPSEKLDHNYICIGVQPENISRLIKKRSWRHKTKAHEDTVKTSIEKTYVTHGDTSAASAETIGENETGSTRDDKGMNDSAVVLEEGEEDDDGSDLESMTDVDVSTEDHVMDVDAKLSQEKSAQQNVSFSKDTMKDIPKEFVGSRGFLDALKYIIIPKMIAFGPELLIISAGFDGYRTDPIGGALHLSLDDYSACTTMLMNAMKEVSQLSEDPQRESRIVSLLEGGYDTSPVTLGLAKCVERHVTTLRNKSTDNA